MKLLLIGAESQIGRALASHLLSQGVVFDELSFKQALETSLAKLVDTYQNGEFQFVINAHHIDGFETEGLDQKQLEQLHVLLPQQAAKLAEVLEIPLLHVSDYQVFSGSKDRPYTEEDEPHSQTLYGGTRRQGELSVQRYCHRFIVLRVGTLLSESGRNVLTVLLEQWKKEKVLELSTLLQFSPTPAIDIARVIYAVLQQIECGAEAWGVYHYCSADTATPFDFAEVLLAARNQYAGDKTEIKITASQDSFSKQRSKKTGGRSVPVNTVMTCTKILNTFGVRQRPWRGELTRMVKSMLQERSSEQD